MCKFIYARNATHAMQTAVISSWATMQKRENLRDTLASWLNIGIFLLVNRSSYGIFCFNE